jgi:hypothetical protein
MLRNSLRILKLMVSYPDPVTGSPDNPSYVVPLSSAYILIISWSLYLASLPINYLKFFQHSTPIYIYIYIYICVCVFVFVCLCVCSCVCVRLCVCV